MYNGHQLPSLYMYTCMYVDQVIQHIAGSFNHGGCGYFLLGLMTLEQMMERRELLVKEREKKLAAALATDEADK